MTDDLFENNKQAPTRVDPATIDDPLAHLVGEDKKFKTPEELAKGKLESDRFIEQLLNEKRELEADLENRIKYEKYLEELDRRINREEGAPGTQRSNSGGERTSSTKEGDDGDKSKLNVTQEELEKLVTQAAETSIKKKEQEDNVRRAQEAAKKALGDGYKSILAERAAERGLDQDLLNEMARRNPKTFLKVLGVGEGESSQVEQTPQKNERMDMFGSNLNPVRTNGSSGGSNTNTPKMSDFSELRRTDPRKYWSAETQRRIFELTKQHGEEFLNN